MTLLSAGDLAGMRATVLDSLAGTAVIQTQTFASDGGGGGSITWTTSGTVACNVAPILSTGGGEITQGERLQPDSEVIFTFPAETSIDHNAQIVYSGGTFTVTGVRRPRSDELSTRVEAKEIE